MSIIPPTIYTLYQYTNRLNGKRYIGVTKELARRMKAHARGWSKAKAFNAAIEKYGIDAFDFQILAIFDDEKAACYHEQAAIINFGTLSPGGYNLAGGAPYTMYRGTVSEEVRAKLSAANKGKKPSEKTRAALIKAIKGKPSWMKGRHHTPEAIEKNRIAHIGVGHPHTPESRAKIRESRKNQIPPQLGRPLSEAHKASISATLMGHPVSPEARAKMGKGAWKNRGKRRSDEVREKMSAAAKSRSIELVRFHTERLLAAAHNKKGKPWSPARRAAYEARKAQKEGE